MRFQGHAGSRPSGACAQLVALAALGYSSPMKRLFVALISGRGPARPGAFSVVPPMASPIASVTACLFAWPMISALALLLACAGPAAADIYRYVDEDGNVIYSDQPHPDAEKIPVPEVQTYSAPAFSEPPPPPAAKPEAPRIVYLTFGIVSPADDQAVRSNNGSLNVEVLLEPALDKSHQLQLLLDEKPRGEPGTATSWSLENVTRGTHTLLAEIIDDTGAVVNRTEPVTFHLLRVSVAN